MDIFRRVYYIIYFKYANLNFKYSNPFFYKLFKNLKKCQLIKDTLINTPMANSAQNFFIFELYTLQHISPQIFTFHSIRFNSIRLVCTFAKGQ